MKTSYKDNVGKRVLIDWGIRSILEVRILEVSPSGERAKIGFNGIAQWVDVWRHDIIETLETKLPTP